MEESGVPDRAKIFREVDGSKKRPRVRLRYFKPIRNGLRNMKKLIESRQTIAETGLAGREKEAKLQKEE